MSFFTVKTHAKFDENLPTVSDAYDASYGWPLTGKSSGLAPCSPSSEQYIHSSVKGTGNAEKLEITSGLGLGLGVGFKASASAIWRTIGRCPSVQAVSKSSPFVPATKPSRLLILHLKNSSYADRYIECCTRLLSLSLTELQKLYPAEYNSMRSRKQQAKTRHKKFDDSLKDFRDWLIHLGPRPAEGWTVDRKNNYKGYVPGNISWQPKLQQTHNRKITKWHSVDGSPFTTKRLAKHLGLSYNCVYKRLRNGWSLQRLLETLGKSSGIESWRFPADVALRLEPKYRARTARKQSRINWYINYLEQWLQKILDKDGDGDEYMQVSNWLDEAKGEMEILYNEQFQAEILERKALYSIMRSRTTNCEPEPRVTGAA